LRRSHDHERAQESHPLRYVGVRLDDDTVHERRRWRREFSPLRGRRRSSWRPRRRRRSADGQGSHPGEERQGAERDHQPPLSRSDTGGYERTRSESLRHVSSVLQDRGEVSGHYQSRGRDWVEDGGRIVRDTRRGESCFGRGGGVSPFFFTARGGPAPFVGRNIALIMRPSASNV
jgi:hypothetical protein